MAHYNRIEEIPKGFWRWTHFMPEEVMCKDGTILVVPEFLDWMEQLRTKCGFALPINSWYRSPSYNTRVAKSGYDGPHTTGMAVDVRCAGESAVKVIECAIASGVKGIGVDQRETIGVLDRYIHLDRTDRPSRMIWSY